MKVLVKLGGTLLDSPDSQKRLAAEIAALREKAEVVVVHGGGKQMTRYLEQHGVASRFINGLRVTTPEVVDAVLKVFAGTVNTQLVAALRAAGARPVGLSGLDAGILDAEPLSPELGSVGRAVRSDPRLIQVLLAAGFLPVIACVAGDANGTIYNINGDQMAAACASSLRVDKLLFLTDVDGVRDSAGEILKTLSAEGARELIRTGVATGGMQAKLEAALVALENRVCEITIAPGSYANVLLSLTNGSGIGTHIY